MFMDDKWLVAGYPLLGYNITNMQGKKARMIYVIMNQNWRWQYELIFSLNLLRYKLYTEIFMDIQIYIGQHIHMFPCFNTYGSRSNDTPVAQAYLSPRSWFLIPFSNKRKQEPLKKWLILGQGQKIQMSQNTTVTRTTSSGLENIQDELVACCSAIK